jgi:hypothetical protein
MASCTKITKVTLVSEISIGKFWRRQPELAGRGMIHRFIPPKRDGWHARLV